MARLTGALKAIDDHYREENRERRDRLSRDMPAGRTVVAGVAVEGIPDDLARCVPRGITGRPHANQRSTGGPWRVRYRYAADHPYMNYTHSCDSAADLVRFMRDHFFGNAHLQVLRVWVEAA